MSIRAIQNEVMFIRSAQIALSGMQAATKQLETSAHNVANGIDEGFEPTSVSAHEVASGGVRVTISDDARAAASAGGGGSSPQSGTDLIYETGARIAASAAFKANLKSLETADDMTSALLDIVGK